MKVLNPKQGDDIEIQAVQARAFEVSRKPGSRELLPCIRNFRGRLPADFSFDRPKANQRR